MYAADRIGNVQILNMKTERSSSEFAAERLPLKLFNTQTDRLYLATDTGMVQCLHETEQAALLVHDEDRKLKKEEVVEKNRRRRRRRSLSRRATRHRSRSPPEEAAEGKAGTEGKAGEEGGQGKEDRRRRRELTSGAEGKE